MRTGVISIDGKKHLLCYSLRVLRLCTERYGSVGGMGEALSSDDELKALDEALWVLSALMVAGSKYANENGIENPAPMSVQQLYDCCDINDFVNIRASIIATLNNGRKTTVEVLHPKNAEATLE